VIAGLSYGRALRLGPLLVALVCTVGIGLIAAPETPLWLGRAVLFGAGVLALSLVRTELGALALLFLLYTHLPELSTTGGSTALVQSLVALPVFAVFAYQLVTRRTRLVVDRVVLCAAAYAATILLSAVFSPNPARSLSWFAHDVAQLAILVLLTNVISSATGLRLATWTLVVAGAFVALAAFAGAALNQDLGGLAVPEQSQIIGDTVGPRLAGVVGESNWLAQALVPILVLALYAIWTERGPVVRLAGLAITLLLAAAIVATFSRGGFVGLVAVLGLALARQRSWRARGIVVGLLLALLTILAPPLYRERMQTLAQLGPGGSPPTDEALRDRLSLLRMGCSWW
jgi:hypothetical protein